jgi:hypothetical protein
VNAADADDDDAARSLARTATRTCRTPRRLLESGAGHLEVVGAVAAAQGSLRALKRRLVLEECRQSILAAAAPAERSARLVRTLGRGLRR